MQVSPATFFAPERETPPRLMLFNAGKVYFINRAAQAALSTQHSALSTQHSALSVGSLIRKSSRFSRTFLRCVLPCFLLPFFLGGCANNSFIGGAKHTISRNDAFMTVDLVMELSGKHRNPQPPVKQHGTGKQQSTGEQQDTGNISNLQPFPLADEDARNQRDRQELAQAFDEFHERIKDKTEDQKKLERNQIQSRLIGASEMACTEFERNLNGMQSSGNFALGSISTVLAGAGAIVTQVDTARLLSGSSAIISGVRSEFNADYFLKQTAAVITKAIDTWRKETRETLLKAQKNKYDEYPVESAIADAIAYNEGCSLVAGLQRVSDAVAVEDDPGLNRLSRLLNKEGKIRATPTGLELTVNTLFAIRAEVSAQIKNTSTPDYLLSTAKSHVTQSDMRLSIEIGKLGGNGQAIASDLKLITDKTKAELDALKTDSDKLTDNYYDAVKKMFEDTQSEQKFLSARAEFYEQLAKISNFKQKIELPVQEFEKSLMPIHAAIDEARKKIGDQLNSTPSKDSAASQSQSVANQATDKNQTSQSNKPNNQSSQSSTTKE